jgi:putative transposase
VTQRGSRRQQTFFGPDDYNTYLSLLREWAPRLGLEVWCYCLMPNHVHLIAVPKRPRALGASLAQVHQRYAYGINKREGWTGHLWQERFASTPMDERHTVAAVRYVLLNPVRAGLVRDVEEWPYSSLRAHLGLKDDGIIHRRALTGLVPGWRALLSDEGTDLQEPIRRQTRSGRPLGDQKFIARLEAATGRNLKQRGRGRPAGKK